LNDRNESAVIISPAYKTYSEIDCDAKESKIVAAFNEDEKGGKKQRDDEGKGDSFCNSSCCGFGGSVAEIKIQRLAAVKGLYGQDIYNSEP
jgi:hypothetical protein